MLTTLFHKAFSRRKHCSYTNAVRLFHGPAEGEGLWKFFSIDSFDQHFWIQHWTKSADAILPDTLFKACQQYDAKSITYSQHGHVPHPAKTVFGSVPEKIIVFEYQAHYIIKFYQQKHPGLFLDQQPLRQWLSENMQDLSVLNLFSYTASLSIAAGYGNAQHVTSVDLSNTYTRWAQENFALNHFSNATFVIQDALSYLKNCVKKKIFFDCIILDPPTFSRQKKGKTFSLASHLAEYIQLIDACLTEEGFFIFSCNAEFASSEWIYETLKKNLTSSWIILQPILAANSFPTGFGKTYLPPLKGFILKKICKIGLASQKK